MSKIVKGLLIAAAIIFTGGTALYGAVMMGASAATLSAIALITNTLALSAVLSGVAETLSPRPRLAGSQVVQTEYSGTVEPRRIIYGRMRVSGMNVIPPITTGTDNQMLHQILVFAGHEIDGIDSYYANQLLVTPAAVTGTSSDGLVSSGQYASLLWVRGYLGTATQTVDFILNAAASATWTVNHRLRGLAYLAMQFKYDSKAYASGKPEMSVVVRGKKCYDPRLDTSPGANPTSATYKTFTTNPALINADYLMDTTVGRKVPGTRINWSDVVTAANLCDTSVAGGNVPPSGAQSLYTCNVVLAAAETPEEHDANQSVLASAMMGVVYRSGGVWRMFAGAWSTSAFSITSADVIGTVVADTEISVRSKFNSIKGVYLSAGNNYQNTEFQPLTNATYIAADGTQRWRDVQFPACTNEYEAQRNAFYLLKQSRDRRSIKAECSLAAAKIRIWETGTLTLPELGWSAQTVRCVGWSLTADGKVSLTLREEYSTDWALPLSADYQTPTGAGAVSVAFTRPGTPASLTATAVPNGIQFAVGLSDPYIPGQVYRLYEAASGGTFAGSTKIAETVGQTLTIDKTDTTSRAYWVTAYANGQESGNFPTTTGTAGAAGTVDPSGAMVSTRGSIPPTVPGSSFSYASTTTSITWSWSTITLYRADGTTVSVSSGSQAFTGLTSGVTYRFYPYMADSGGTSGTVSFVTGGTGGGSPAGAYGSAGDAAAAASMYARANIPLGPMSGSTTTSGGGSGGGGGSSCLHPEQVMVLRDGQLVPAAFLEVGACLPTPEGSGRIVSVKRLVASRWIRLGFEGAGDILVTPDHRLLCAAGGEVRAEAVRLGDLLASHGDHLRVVRLALEHEAESLVSIELEAPHFYFLGPDGVLCHNPKP